jgi:ribosome-associated toxin RatA of RatAB toxin-antitoxin module
MGAPRLIFALALAPLALGCGAASTQATWVDKPSVQPLQHVPAVVGDPAPAPDATQGAERQPVTEALPIEGTDRVRGRSTVIVDAPIAAVKKTLLRYGKYAEFMPHYSASKVLRRMPESGHEVYMQVEALYGAVKLWARLEMTPKRQGDTEIITSKFVDGNVKDFSATWTLAPVDAQRTELTLEVFLHPDLPMPSKTLNHENVQGAEKGVIAMRKRVESGR